jgi:hypothetical protein
MKYVNASAFLVPKEEAKNVVSLRYNSLNSASKGDICVCNAVSQHHTIHAQARHSLVVVHLYYVLSVILMSDPRALSSVSHSLSGFGSEKETDFPFCCCFLPPFL